MLLFTGRTPRLLPHWLPLCSFWPHRARASRNLKGLCSQTFWTDDRLVLCFWSWEKHISKDQRCSIWLPHFEHNLPSTCSLDHCLILPPKARRVLSTGASFAHFLHDFGVQRTTQHVEHILVAWICNMLGPSKGALSKPGLGRFVEGKKQINHVKPLCKNGKMLHGAECPAF